MSINALVPVTHRAILESTAVRVSYETVMRYANDTGVTKVSSTMFNKKGELFQARIFAEDGATHRPHRFSGINAMSNEVIKVVLPSDLGRSITFATSFKAGKQEQDVTIFLSAGSMPGIENWECGTGKICCIDENRHIHSGTK